MADTTKTKKLRFFGLGKMKPYIAKYKGTFTLIVIFTMLIGGLNSVLPLFQSYAINNFIANKTLDGLTPFIAVYVV